MIYAHVTNGTIDATGKPRNLRTGDGASVLMSDTISDAMLAACGWHPVVVTDQPIPGPTEVVTRNPPTVIDGIPTVTWTVRAKTQAELDAEAAAAADEVERQAARDAIADLNAYLALGSPTAAQVRQAVDFLAKVSKRLIVDQYGAA